jgi:dTDP-glucose 4,6-dehydratase
MKILVTGGCGFIGSNFIHWLRREQPDYEIINLDALTYAGNMANLAEISGQYTFIRGDIGDRHLVNSILQREQPDGICHFAAESHVDRSIVGPDAFMTTNIIGTYVLLEAARGLFKIKPNLRFLYVSTDEVYGSLGPTGYFSETSPYEPNSPYSASKASADHLVRAYGQTYGLPVLTSHCSNNYGPYQFPEKLIPLIIRNALLGLDLPVYGDGKNIRDWIYVEDHCHALHEIYRRGRVGEVYNIGGNTERENIEIVRQICDRLDEKVGPLPNRRRRESIRFVKDRPGHDRRYAMDITKIRRELGWTPRFSFETGLDLTIAWYIDHADWLQKVIDGSYLEYYQNMYGHVAGVP